MKIEDYLIEQIRAAMARKGFAVAANFDFSLERPKSAAHGDLSTNVAMLLAASLKRRPREIATDLLQALQTESALISKAEVAGAGFINFHLSRDYFRAALQSILAAGQDFGHADWGQHTKVQIEFVSANPTGPLNVVSARAATVGDVLASLMQAVGFEVEREFYVNDAGRQVKLLGMSLSSRYMELLGLQEPFPEEGYHGDYIRDYARELADQEGDRYARLEQEQRWAQFTRLAVEKMIAEQKTVLGHYRVNFDHWFRESKLRQRNAHEAVLRRLAEQGHLYEKEGAQWFAASQFGDEKDRVLVTSAGEPTYFLVDIAYHLDKFQRGFEKIYDLWGPDHHGYINRMKAALEALGYDRSRFEVKIIQQVNLLEKGQVVKMSKRAGKIIEMRELIEEVGVDVARYFFVARRNESPLDFDMDLAKNTSEENPVFYVQYAHARICNILKFAEEKKIARSEQSDLARLTELEEFDLIKKLLEFPDVVTKAAKFLEPHRLPNYLHELAATFHRFYHHRRVVTDDEALTGARLVLVEATRIVLANALALLGITAPERM
ncbi:MAG: arginine--tRNA ligase [bacterium]